MSLHGREGLCQVSGSHPVNGPLDLIEFYRRRGARYFADLGSRAADPRRKGLHDAVRRRYKVIVDRPDVIIADVDGIVVVPRLEASDTRRLASERFAKESKTRERLKNGELGLDFYGLRAKLTELGVVYVEKDE